MARPRRPEEAAGPRKMKSDGQPPPGAPILPAGDDLLHTHASHNLASMPPSLLHQQETQGGPGVRKVKEGQPH